VTFSLPEKPFLSKKIEGCLRAGAAKKGRAQRRASSGIVHLYELV